MAINYSKNFRYIAGLLAFTIIFSLILTPRLTLNSFRPCEKREIKIVYKFGNAGAWSSFGRYNELNTIRGTYKRDMMSEGTLTTRFCLTDEELETIYNKVVGIDFFNYNEYSIYSDDKRASLNGISTRILEISNGESKNSLQWYSYGIEYGDEWLKNLNDLANLIWNIIENNPEYKDIPKPNSGYA